MLARVSALGFTNALGLRADTPLRIGLVDGAAVVAHRNGRGMLTIDVGQGGRPAGHGSVEALRRAVDHAAHGLDGVHVHGATRIVGRAEFTGPDAVTGETVLAGDAGGARLELTARLGAGTYALRLVLADRAVESDVVVRVPRRSRRPVTLRRG